MLHFKKRVCIFPEHVSWDVRRLNMRVMRATLCLSGTKGTEDERKRAKGLEAAAPGRVQSCGL